MLELNLLSGPLPLQSVLAFATLALASLYFAKKKNAFSKEKFHSDPKVISVNRLSSHAALSGFSSETDARKYCAQPKCSPFVKVLNGIWHFQLFDSVDAALAIVGHWDERLLAKERKSIETIQVPGHWQLQVPGDAPIYTNIKYIIPVDPPNLPLYNPTGYYHTKFSISKSWQLRRNYLNFGGVDNAFYVWCNKKFVGFAKDSRLQSEFDITTCLFYDGEPNEIEVVVIRYSDGYYLEDQDMFNISGIFRDVTIVSLPNDVRIKDFYWTTTMDSNTQIASVTVNIRLNWNMDVIALLLDARAKEIDPTMNPHANSYLSQLQSDWVVETRIFEEGILISSFETPTSHSFLFDNPSHSHICMTTSYAPVPGLTSKFGRALIQHMLFVNSPAQWSAEKPHIYTLVVSLRSSYDGCVVQAEACRMAFRTVDINSGLLRINQRPVLIRGVNYHEHDPLTGHSVPHNLVEADIKLMKRNNFNAVRLSHYPQAPWVYELCSLYGLYVVDEANIESHGMKPYAGKLADDPKWENAFMTRLTRMVQRDRSHPCIIFWSLGNESGYGAIHDKMAAWIRMNDTTRILMYEPASYGPREESQQRVMATDILCPMYSRIDDCIKLANIFPDLPVIQCEYAHMMGNSGGNLSEYWEAFHRFPRFQGGFIWDWVDQGLSIVDSKGGLKWAYGGDFGEVSHDANFCLNGLNWPDRGLPWVLSRGKTKDRSKWGQQRGNMSNLKPYYGLTGTSMMDHDNVGSSETVNRIIDVDGAMSKPVMLEAKQCQKFFECRVIGMKIPAKLGAFVPEAVDPISSNSPSSRYIYLENEGVVDEDFLSRRNFSILLDSSPVTALASESIAFFPKGSSLMNAHKLGVTLRFSIINKYDIIDDIQTELEFYSFLLCDGVVVADSPVRTLTSGYVHRDNSINNPNETGSGRHSIQELECEGRFKLKCYEITSDIKEVLDYSKYAGPNFEIARSVDSNVLDDESSHSSAPSEFALFGLSWAQQTLLDTDTIEKISQDLQAIMKLPPFKDSKTVNSNKYWTRIIPTLSHVHHDTDKDSSNNADNFNHASFHAQHLEREKWSVVVIGRSIKDTVWANKHYPLGFYESDCTNLVKKAIDPSFQLVASKASTPVVRNQYNESFRADHGMDIMTAAMNKIWKNEGRSSPPKMKCNNVRVTWIPSTKLRGDEEKAIEWLCDANILLQTDIPANPLSNSWLVEANKPAWQSESKSSPARSVQVVINGLTGMIDSIKLNGEDILASPDILSGLGNVAASRVHLHRAVTDNDRYGYLPSWNATGLNSDLTYKPTGVSPMSDGVYTHDGDFEVLGKHVFSNISVERLPEGADGSQGIICSWSMEPSFVDRPKVRIIKQILAFLEDPRAHSTILYARNSSEESYIHQMASIYRIGRESVRSPNVSYQDGRGIRVKIWKVAMNMCSTIPRAELLAGAGPLGVAPDREDKTPIELLPPLNHYEEDGSIGPVTFETTYVLTAAGELQISATVDTSKMVVVIPRIGFQYQIDPSFTQVTWKGAGPHESYPDRKASCVNAVHSSPISQMHTPYIVPGENGSRTNISWVQLERPASQPLKPELVDTSYANTELAIWSPRDSFAKLEGLVNGSRSVSPLKTASHERAFSINSLAEQTNSNDFHLLDELCLELEKAQDQSIRDGPPSAQRIPSTTSAMMRISSSRHFNFSAQPFMTEDLSIATHFSDLDYHSRPFTSLNIDAHIMGVGGDDSWTACVHEDYLLPPDVYSFDLSFNFHSQ